MPAKLELDALMRDAKETATLRSHRMGDTVYYSFVRASSQCIDCGMEVYVTTKPWPNETDIAGEAVALTCRREGASA